MFHYLDVESKLAEEGAQETRIRWLITKDDGAKNFAMRLFEVDVGGYTPLHKHAWEHEIFVLEGEGQVLGEEGTKQIVPGDVIYIPPNENHQLKNTGKRKLKFLCLIPYLDV
ncbi:MAG: cupin domain-containing protein [Candidatus Bathyarchaeia archaeon]